MNTLNMMRKTLDDQRKQAEELLKKMDTYTEKFIRRLQKQDKALAILTQKTERYQQKLLEVVSGVVQECVCAVCHSIYLTGTCCAYDVSVEMANPYFKFFGTQTNQLEDPAHQGDDEKLQLNGLVAKYTKELDKMKHEEMKIEEKLKAARDWINDKIKRSGRTMGEYVRYIKILEKQIKEINELLKEEIEDS
ncbi:hypothetical protein TSAR_010050 [Trichomalopsis sarcophagae]|uniref:Uncharacterized protein n=1 Tax=Trichomalopsis sarcophagae TaxID=543379 RepID=A0A232EQK1_9HYME|nr:hypothetical protein TSAR_010050 [Trichomalopsis sarcophagae]